jgi:transcriptional regulator with XRE-family HTH domain
MPIRLLPKRLIGQTVRGIRTRLGQTPAEFAESLGVQDPRTVTRWEEGQTQPDYGTLAKIATMGLVDVLVFHDTTPSDEAPQLTPGEATELRTLLARMENLLAEARQIVERASERTVVEVLESSVSRPTAPALAALADGGGLRAELNVEVKARRTGAKSRGRSTKNGKARETKSSAGGGSKRNAKSTSARSDGGSKSRARSEGTVGPGS